MEKLEKELIKYYLIANGVVSTIILTILIIGGIYG